MYNFLPHRKIKIHFKKEKLQYLQILMDIKVLNENGLHHK